MELDLYQRFAAAVAMRKGAEELEKELRPQVNEAAIGAYLNDPTHPDRQTIVFSNGNGFAEVGRITVKKGKGTWRVADPGAFYPWAIDAGVATPELVVYPDRVTECAEALKAAGLEGAFYVTAKTVKGYEKGFVDNGGAAPIWKETGEVVDGLEWEPAQLSTMVTGCTLATMKTAERTLGAPIIGTAVLEGGTE